MERWSMETQHSASINGCNQTRGSDAQCAIEQTCRERNHYHCRLVSGWPSSSHSQAPAPTINSGPRELWRRMAPTGMSSEVALLLAANQPV